jgi:uncharacterized protein YoxC
VDAGISPDSAKQILDALGGLKTVVALSLISAITGVAILWLLTRYFDKRLAFKHEEAMRKSEAAEQVHLDEAKAVRAQEMRATWAELTKEVKGMRSETKAQTDQFKKHMEDDDSAYLRLTSVLTSVDATTKSLSQSVLELGASVREVSVKQVGGLSRSNAMLLIEQTIRDVIQRDAVDLFDYSIRMNDYARRAEVIKTRVKTAIGKSISEAARNFSAYQHLSVSPACYLPYYSDAGGIRYHVCDRLWDAVRPIYVSHDDPIEERLADMRTIVGNIFSDTISAGRDVAENFYDYDEEKHDPMGVFRPAGDTSRKHRSGEHHISAESALTLRQAPLPT